VSMKNAILWVVNARKLVVLVIIVVILASSCGGRKDPIDSDLYQSNPGSKYGDVLFDSDHIEDPAHDRGLYIW
jgi:hypothetical protein